MSAYDEYAKVLREQGDLQKQSQDLSTKAQFDQLAESKKLVEAEKQNAFRGAYVDYAKNINPYGVQSELAYGAGLGGSGKGETAQANYYNTYQNRLGEINTNVTGQLRDIANQETTVRLAGDQAKLAIDATVAQQLAAAQREDDLLAGQYAREDAILAQQNAREDKLLAAQYAREDKANAYNRLLTAITSAGYTPSDEELAAAGMTRSEANAYTNAYKQSLYSGESPSGAKARYLDSDGYNAIEEKVRSYYEGGYDIDDAEAYLFSVLGNGYANFTEEDAAYLLNKAFPKDGTKTMTKNGMIYQYKDGKWVATGGYA